jgi:hypothetical protein
MEDDACGRGAHHPGSPAASDEAIAGHTGHTGAGRPLLRWGALTPVNVDTRQGVVELNGTVDTNAAKLRATELAQQVDGVRRVVNNLKVQGS